MFLLYGAPSPLSLLGVEQEFDDLTGGEVAAVGIFRVFSLSSSRFYLLLFYYLFYLLKIIY